jgi:hypothetical protein
MKRGHAPPLDLRERLTRGEKLHKAVYKTRQGPEPSVGQFNWLARNCGTCNFLNVEMVITAKLVDDPIRWKHLCCHPGPTRLLKELRQSGVNCSGHQASLMEVEE